MKPIKSINTILLIPFLLVLATVFIVSNNLTNGVVTGKYFWFYVSIIGVAVSSLLFLLLNKNSRIRFGLVDLLVLFYALSVFLLMPKWEGISQKQVILSLIFCLYFYFRLILHSYRFAAYLLPVFFICTGFAESVIGLAQLYGFTASNHSLFKITGTFFNPGPFSGYLAMVTPVAVYYAVTDRKVLQHKYHKRLLLFWIRWIVAMLTIVAVFLILPAAMSRAAWIGTLAGCGLVIVFVFLNDRKYKKILEKHKSKIKLVVPVLLLLLMIGFAGMYYLKKDSADGRLLIWKNSLTAIVQHPMGSGLGSFSGKHAEAQAAYFESGKGTEQEEIVAGNPEYAFNEFLQIGIEQGVVSLLMFVLLLTVAIYSGLKRKKVAAVGSLVALLVFALASYPFSVLPFLIGLVFLLAWMNNSERLKPKYNRIFSYVIIIFCTFITGYAVYSVYPTKAAYKSWNYSVAFYHSKAYETTVQKYAPISPLLSDQVSFLFEYGQSLSKSEQYKESSQILQNAARLSGDPMLYNVMGKNYQALKQYDEAEKCFLKASYIVPNRVYPYYLLAKLYLESGQFKKAKDMAKIVLTKEPKVHSTAIEEMRKEMKKLLFE